MIVVDASAVAELLLSTAMGGAVATRLLGAADLHSPSHLDIEVVGVIRRAVARGLLTEHDGQLAMADLRTLRIRRWPPLPFVDRAYALRATHTVADAVYVALAEALSCPLLTCDARLARSHGHAAVIELP